MRKPYRSRPLVCGQKVCSDTPVKRSLFLAVTWMACSREPAPAPTVAVIEPASGSPASSVSPAAPASPDVTAATTMNGAKPGEPITLRGHVATVMWQHMTTGVAGKKLAYFDLRGGKEQTVVYWTETPKCAGDIEVTGKVLELRGPSKRPHEPETKVDDSYSERHVDVTSARCVDP